MGQIAIEGIQLHAFHGCLEEEAKIGGHYQVDVYIETDYTEAALTDELVDTVDYVEVFEIVKKEMAIRSKLIEHVARRIAYALTESISKKAKYMVKLTKFNPPVNGPVEKCSVTWESRRE